jgi:AcrR family transcriptional regulator
MPAAHSRSKLPTKWQRRPEARPEEILCAAVHVFGEEGFARAKLEDVARRAGVSKGTLYLYFDSKDTLFREMVKARITPVFAEAQQTMRGFQGSARELLEWMIRCMWDTIRRPEMIHIARIVHAELANFPELARFYFDEVILRNRALLRTTLERGIATGEFHRVAHDFILRAVPSLQVNGAMYQRGFGVYDPKPLTDYQKVEGVQDLVMNGLLTRPEAGPA